MLWRSNQCVSRILLCRPSMVLAQRNAIHSTAITSKSAKEVVKENLEKLNKKIGQVAAEGIEKTQEASHKASEFADQKMGQVEEMTKSSKEQLKGKTQSTMGRAGEKASDMGEKVEDKARNFGEKAEELTHDAKKTASRNIEDAQDYVDHRTK
ncbi:hypothetical protein HG537_0B05360 [Torulaspora globosa]|uniref:Uncharacterized protein n=1 Tax=Torulaspora globosa TaxID=48254 RepID=A0A7H9HPI3_9SACH|nr:hypothetical protein HG537_0B05360 [Torulaspora sp. CBS 2947]